jgi:tetratricopeptide (TPR) repeat protein
LRFCCFAFIFSSMSKKRSGFPLNPWLLALLGLTLLAYSGVFDNEFVNWDDRRYIVENEQVHDFSAENVKSWFSEEVSDNYHPLTNFSQTLDYVLGGGEPWLFHLTNLLFHLLNSLLVFLLIRQLGKAEWAALLVAAIFALHPMHVESVAWAAERKDVLYTFFFLLSLRSYLKYLDQQLAKKYLGLALLWGLLSLLSKPAAVPLPLILLLLDAYRGRSWKSRRLWLEKIPFFALALAVGLLTIAVQADDAIRPLAEIQWLDQISFASYGFVMYGVKFFFPYPLFHFYPYPPADSIPFYFYLMPIVALGMLGLAVVGGRKNKDLQLGFWLFALMLSTTLQLLPIGGTIMADRYSYVPFIGLGLIVVWGVEKGGWDQGKKGQIMRYVGLTVALLWAALSWRQVAIWQNSETLWTHRIEKGTQPVAIAYTNRGEHFKRTGQPAKALADFQQALRIDPQETGALRLRAKIYLDQGKLIEARRDYEQLLAVSREDPTDWQNFAIILNKQGETAEALAALARARLLQGQRQQALQAIEQALQRKPGNAAYQQLKRRIQGN